MDSKKEIYLVFILTFFLFLSGFSVFSVLQEDQPRSSQENRSLAQFPDFYAEELTDGSWFQKFESYNKDQFPFRARCMQCYYHLLDCLQVTERNGFIRGKNDAILSTHSSQITENRINAAKKYGVNNVETMTVLDAVAEEWGGKVIYLNIPHKNEFFVSQYPDYYNSDEKINEYKRISITEKAAAAGIPVVETYDTMKAHENEYLYFLSDNHYTMRGAYYAYLDLLNCINTLDPTLNLTFPDLTELDITVNRTRFAGTYLRKWGDSGSLAADYMEFLIPPNMPEYTRYDDGEQSDIPLYNLSKSSYTSLMGSDYGNTVVDTNREDLPSILYLGYSYSNALEALSVYNFNRIESIDPRHWTGSISEYMRQSQPDYIVIVRDDIYAENSGFTCTVE